MKKKKFRKVSNWGIYDSITLILSILLLIGSVWLTYNININFFWLDILFSIFIFMGLVSFFTRKTHWEEISS